MAGLAAAALGERSRVPWLALVEDYDRIRERIERVVPGFEDYARRARAPGGFLLPSGARASADSTRRRGERGSACTRFPRTRSRRGASGSRRSAATTSSTRRCMASTTACAGCAGIAAWCCCTRTTWRRQGLREGQAVDLTSHFRGETRTLRGFRVVPYDLPRRCAAAYFPEANGLVPLESQAERSHTPSYKSIEISVTPAGNLE